MQLFTASVPPLANNKDGCVLTLKSTIYVTAKRVSSINKWSLLMMWKQLDASHHNSRLEEAIQLSHRWNKRPSKWKE
jgi:hypothetical protein